MKVVVDTNIWIGYLIGGLLQELDEWTLSKKVAGRWGQADNGAKELLASEEISYDC